MMKSPLHKCIQEVAAEAEQNYIIVVLETVNWNISQVAQILKINRSTLFRKMRRYGIKRRKIRDGKSVKGGDIKINTT